MTTLALILIIFLFWCLAAYSLWWLFFSRERIFNIIPMSQYIKDESRRALLKKLENLRRQRAKLQRKIQRKGYTPVLDRKVNIIDHHINVTKQRLNGQWNNPDYPYKILEQ